MVRNISSSRRGSGPTSNWPPRVRVRPFREESTRRESISRLAEGNRNLLSLNSDSSPRQRRSASSTGRMRTLCRSIKPRESAAVVSGVTLKTSVSMTSRTLGETSATKRGEATPKVWSTKSMRSLVSPQRAATAPGMPVRRLNSAYPMAEQMASVSGLRWPMTKTSFISRNVNEGTGAAASKRPGNRGKGKRPEFLDRINRMDRMAAGRRKCPEFLVRGPKSGEGRAHFRFQDLKGQAAKRWISCSG